MPPRAKFTREQLQAAALAIVDAQGLAALSMRSLAATLGTGAMTIYNYLRDRDELDALVVEAVLAQARWPAVAGVDWQQDVRLIARGFWQAIKAHPDVIPLILTRRGLHEAAVEGAEALLRALAASDRSGLALLAAFRIVMGFILGLAQAQLARPRTGNEPAATIERFRGLDPALFPRLIEIAGVAQAEDIDQEFEAGLDIVLAGLASRVA